MGTLTPSPVLGPPWLILARVIHGPEPRQCEQLEKGER